MIKIISFGYLHGGLPLGYDLLLDARDLIRDPHVDPALRQMTGHDVVVRDAVMGTPGAEALINLLFDAMFLAGGHERDLTVAIGCQGGRHRSVVLADQLGGRLFAARCSVDQIHRDVDQPVVAR
jgi:RNase adaptor protein for sRNA GlmZ degradation